PQYFYVPNYPPVVLHYTVGKYVPNGSTARLCTKSLYTLILCATSVFPVSLWCVFARNSSTTETQRTQRLHREEGLHDFLCKAQRLPPCCKLAGAHDISPRAVRRKYKPT